MTPYSGGSDIEPTQAASLALVKAHTDELVERSDATLRDALIAEAIDRLAGEVRQLMLRVAWLEGHRDA